MTFLTSILQHTRNYSKTQTNFYNNVDQN